MSRRANGSVRVRHERRGGVVEHARSRQHVAGHREAVAGPLTAPLDARRAGVRGDTARGVDQVELPVVAAGVRGDQRAHDVGRIDVPCHRVERGRRVQRIDERLRRERADAARRVRTQRADREEPARDGHAERAGGVAGDERPGHAWEPAPGPAYAGRGCVKYAWRMW